MVTVMPKCKILLQIGASQEHHYTTKI